MPIGPELLIIILLILLVITLGLYLAFGRD